MYEYADIKAYKPDREGTHLQIFIPDRHLEEAWCGWTMEDILAQNRGRKHMQRYGILQILLDMLLKK